MRIFLQLVNHFQRQSDSDSREPSGPQNPEKMSPLNFISFISDSADDPFIFLSPS